MAGSIERSRVEMTEADGNLEYISCIRIFGQPILPPLMTPERREEMRCYRAKAEDVEKKLKDKVKPPSNISLNQVRDPRSEARIALKSSSSFKQVNPHEILEEFDPFSPSSRFAENQPENKSRHSGSSDEFSTSKTGSSGRSATMTNSTDLYHYMDLTGSSTGDGRSTRRSFTPMSTPGTMTEGDWNSPLAVIINDSNLFGQRNQATYEGLNEYLDSILNSSAPTPSSQTYGYPESTRDQHTSTEEATPTNADTFTQDAGENRRTGLDERRRVETRPASCPLSPIPHDSLVDSAIGSLSEKNDSSGSLQHNTEQLIDLANPAEDRKKAAQPTPAAKTEQTVPRLVRSNSYTLDSPSPMLLALLEAEKRKTQSARGFNALKQTNKTVSASRSKLCNGDKSRNGVNTLKNNEGQLTGVQTRKENSVSKARVCYSPQGKMPNPSTTGASAVHNGGSAANVSPKMKKNRLSQPQKSTKACVLPVVGTLKTLAPRTESMPPSDISTQSQHQDLNGTLPDRVRKVFSDLQAEHNRQMEELLSRQRKEQELVRQAILQQKDLVSKEDSDSVVVRMPGAGNGGTFTWASLLRTNLFPENDNRTAEVASTGQHPDDMKRLSTSSTPKAQDNSPNKSEISEKSTSVLHEYNLTQNHNNLASSKGVARSASGESLYSQKESSSVCRSLSSSFLLSQISSQNVNNIPESMFASVPEGSYGITLNTDSRYRCKSLSEAGIDSGEINQSRNMNQVLMQEIDRLTKRPSSTPGQRATSKQDVPRSHSSACDDFISLRDTKAPDEPQVEKNANCSRVLSDLTAVFEPSSEVRVNPAVSKTTFANPITSQVSFVNPVPITNPLKDTNGNLSQTDNLNSKNLLESFDANENAVNSVPVIQHFTREISVRGGVVTCYSEILSAESFPAAANPPYKGIIMTEQAIGDGEASQNNFPSLQTSPRLRRKAWGNWQTAADGSQRTLGDPDWLGISRERQKHSAATKIQAAIRGYLTRRLLRTEKVQNCISVIHDTILCALQLQKECARNVEPSDLQLHGRLIHQLSDACREVHNIFVELPVAKRMAIIAADRERLQKRTPKLQKPTTPLPLSRATQIALSRKMMQQSHNHSTGAGPAVVTNRRKNWSNVDTSQNRSSCSSCTQDHFEVIAGYIVRTATTAMTSDDPQKSANVNVNRKPWR